MSRVGGSIASASMDRKITKRMRVWNQRVCAVFWHQVRTGCSAPNQSNCASDWACVVSEIDGDG
eukprot:3578533-Rhodomonas_salina.3